MIDSAPFKSRFRRCPDGGATGCATRSPCELGESDIRTSPPSSRSSPCWARARRQTPRPSRPRPSSSRSGKPWVRRLGSSKQQSARPVASRSKWSRALGTQRPSPHIRSVLQSTRDPARASGRLRERKPKRRPGEGSTAPLVYTSYPRSAGSSRARAADAKNVNSRRCPRGVHASTSTSAPTRARLAGRGTHFDIA